jgi:hypothetical protein
VFPGAADRRDGREWHAAPLGVKNAGPPPPGAAVQRTTGLVLDMFSHYLLFDPE